MDDVPFLRRGHGIDRHGSKLPHWQQGRAAVFITFRLADSIPVSRWQELKRLKAAWMRHHGGDWNEELEKAWGRKEVRRFHQLLDAGYGSCALRSEMVREPINRTLRYGDGVDYELIAAVVMPNHVHVLISPCEEKSLAAIIGAWKSVSSRQLAKLRPWCGWQRNYHDRLIRNQKHLRRVVGYIAANPVRLSKGSYWHYEREGLDGGGSSPAREG